MIDLNKARETIEQANANSPYALDGYVENLAKNYVATKIAPEMLEYIEYQQEQLFYCGLLFMGFLAFIPISLLLWG